MPQQVTRQMQRAQPQRPPKTLPPAFPNAFGVPPPPTTMKEGKGSGWSGMKEMLADVGDLLGGGPEMQNTGTPEKPLYEAVEQIDPRSKKYGANLFGASVAPEGFFSHAERVLNASKQGKFEGSQLINFLKSKGVKDEELRWTGLNELLQKPKVSREEALELLKKAPRVSEKIFQNYENNPEYIKISDQYDAINEKWHDANREYSEAVNSFGHDSDEAEDALTRVYNLQDEMRPIGQKLAELKESAGPQYEQYVLPGPHENYRELLLKHEPQHRQDFPDKWEIFHPNTKVVHHRFDTEEEAIKQLEKLKAHGHEGFTDELAMTYFKELQVGKGEIGELPPPKFQAAHHQEDDVIAHIRLNDRYLPAERYTPMYNKAMEEFKQAGISLDTSWPTSGRPANLRMRKWGTQESVSPDSLPQELRAKWDALQEASQREALNPFHPDRGDKVLHAEEFQSDWANQGQSKGFKNPEYEKLHNLWQEKNSIAHNVDDQMNELRVNFDYYNRHFNEGDPKLIEARKQYREERRKLQAYRDAVHAEMTELYNKKHALKSGDVEPGPFVEGSWGELSVKRTLLEAARDPDVKYVTWTTGQQQAERYSLDRRFSRLELITLPNGKEAIRAWEHGSNIPRIEQRITKDQKLEDFIGDELAERLRRQKPDHRPTAHETTRTLMSHDMKVEDKGKRQAYDVARKSEFKRLTKQEPQLIDIQSAGLPTDLRLQNLENRQEEETVDQFMSRREEAKNNPRQKVWSIKMTPELRARILKEGFPLYAIAPMMATPSDRKPSKPLPPPMKE